MLIFGSQTDLFWLISANYVTVILSKPHCSHQKMGAMILIIIQKMGARKLVRIKERNTASIYYVLL